MINPELGKPPAWCWQHWSCTGWKRMDARRAVLGDVRVWCVVLRGCTCMVHAAQGCVSMVRDTRRCTSRVHGARGCVSMVHDAKRCTCSAGGCLPLVLGLYSHHSLARWSPGVLGDHPLQRDAAPGQPPFSLALAACDLGQSSPQRCQICFSGCQNQCSTKSS